MLTNSKRLLRSLIGFKVLSVKNKTDSSDTVSHIEKNLPS